MSTMEKQNASRSRRSFTKEFKADAVAMVLDTGRKIVNVAEAIGVGEGTLGNWVRLEPLASGKREDAGRDQKTRERNGSRLECVVAHRGPITDLSVTG